MVHIFKSVMTSAIIMLMTSFSVVATEVNDQVTNMAKELEKNSKAYSKQKIAILQFRTDKNKLTPFNKFIQDEMVLAYSKSTKFEVIDINATNRIIEDLNWDILKVNDFNFYNKISEQIFKELGIVPSAFIYGQINDNDETITITGYLVPNGLKSSNIQSVVRFESTEQTDKLLGKPVVNRKKVEPEVVYKEKVVEKEVIKEVPVYVEKEVVKEVPVYVEKEVIKEIPVEVKNEPSEHVKMLGNLKIEIVSAVFNGSNLVVTFLLTNDVEDQVLPSCWTRFFDQEGNEYKYSSSTLQYAKLIAGVTAKKTCTFDRDGLSRAKVMKVLEIEVGNQGKVLFKNVKITN